MYICIANAVVFLQRNCPKWAEHVHSDAASWLSPAGPPALNIQANEIDGDFHLFKRNGTDTWTNAMMLYQA